MAAARMLGLAGGRLRSAAAVVGPRLTPFALDAGRRCPLAPTAGRRCPLAPALLAPTTPTLLAPTSPALLVPNARGKAEEEVGVVKAKIADVAPRTPTFLRRAAEDDAGSVKLVPFSTGAAQSGGEMPGKKEEAGVVKAKVADVAPRVPALLRPAAEDDARSGKILSFSAHSDGEKPGKAEEEAGVVKDKIPDAAGGLSKKAGANGGVADRRTGEEAGADGKVEDEAGGRTSETGIDKININDGKDVDAGGLTNNAAVPANGNIITNSDGGDSDNSSGEEDMEDEDMKPPSKNMIVSFTKIVETIVNKFLKAEWKRVDEELHDHFRRVIYLILAGVLLELVTVVGAAMLVGAWLGILKIKNIIKYLTTSPEVMEMYLQAADVALSILYDASMGKGRKLIASILSIFVASEKGKVGEEGKMGHEDKVVEPAGEDGARAGEEGASARAGEGAVLMVLMFVIFLL